MNKKITRIIAIVLVAVLLLGLLPLFANAETIQPRSLTQENGVYYFETVDDLKELIDASFSDQVWVIYRGEGDLVIDEAIALSENLQLWCDGYTLRITENGWLECGDVTCDDLILEGFLKSGWVSVNQLEATGEMYLREGIGVDFDQLDMEELWCIYSASGEDILIDLDVEAMDQLYQALDWAQNDPLPEHNFRIYFEPYDVELTENLEIPENCRVQVYHLVIPADICVTGGGELATVDWIQVYGNLEVENLNIFYYGGGMLTVEEGGCLSCESIVIDAYEPLDMESLADTLRGVDFADYDIVDNDGVWELTPKGESDQEQEMPASGTCGENLTWTLEDGVLTISGLGPMEDYSVLDGTFAGWHKYNNEINAVIVEDGVTTIGEAAFHECRMTSISLPDSITSIGNFAFQWCGKLTDITIPDSVATIGRGAFNYNGVKSIVIPNNVTTIEDFAFNDCRLESVTISGSVTHIGSWAFAQCFDLTEILFQGDAPEMESSQEGEYVILPFMGVTATAYYPAGNDTWTEEAMASCGGNLTWVPYTSEDAEAVPGDLSGDGEVDSNDVAQLLWYTLFPQDYAISGNADFNGDGSVDNADVAHLLWHTLFPEDYPL